VKTLIVLLLLSLPALCQPCPRQVQVGSYRYELRFDLLDSSTFARTDFDRFIIHVGVGYPEDEMREAMFHELMHTAMYQTLGRTADYFKRHKYEDEQFIESVAPMLVKTLTTYPELITCEMK
jgi:hypothetical protein